jgi:tetratricopeptide (TPR) repeat protein
MKLRKKQWADPRLLPQKSPSLRRSLCADQRRLQPALVVGGTPLSPAQHAVLGEDVEPARRYGPQVLDELAQDHANSQTLEFLHQLSALLAPTASPWEMLRLSQALGQVHRSLGQLEAAATWYQQYLDLATQTADPRTQAVAHFEVGELALVTNDYEAAAGAAQRGLDIDIPLEDARHTVLLGRGQRLLGTALAMEGSDLSAAEYHLQEAVAAHLSCQQEEHLAGAPPRWQ